MPSRPPESHPPQIDYVADFHPRYRTSKIKKQPWFLPLASRPLARKNLFTLVGTRNGEASVCWSGVVRYATFLAILYSLLNVIEHFAFGWKSKPLPDSIVSIFVYTGFFMGMLIWLGLKLPPERLPKLD